MKKRIVSLLLLLALITALLPAGYAHAISPYFFQSHSDWRFDLTKEPNRPMTVEELIALSTACSF